MEGFNKQRLFIAIAAGVGVLAALLPWASTFMGSIGGLRIWWGWLSLFLFAGAGAMVFIGDKSQGVSSKFMTVVLILGGLGALFSLINIFRFISQSFVSPGLGLYLTFLAGLALVGIYFFVNEKGEISTTPKKVDFNEIKEDLKDVTEDIKEMTDKDEKTETTETTESTETKEDTDTPPQS